MASVLLIEHDPAVAELSRRYLERERFAIRLARTPSEAAAALAEAAAGRYSPDAVVLDLTMPGLRGREIRRALCQPAGKPGPGTARPLVGLAGPGGLRPREAGVPGSSCLRRPFGPRSLVVTVHAALAAAAQAGAGTASSSTGRISTGGTSTSTGSTRRSAGRTGGASASGSASASWSASASTRIGGGSGAAAVAAADRDQVMQQFADVALTATERELLSFLVSNPGRVFTRERLLAALREAAGAATVPGTAHPGGYQAGAGGYGSGVPGGVPGNGPGGGLRGKRNGPAGPRAVDVYVAQLRAKLGDRSPIRTVRGVGYAARA